MNAEKFPLFSLPVLDLNKNLSFFKNIGFSCAETKFGIVLNDGTLSILLTDKDQLPAGLVFGMNDPETTFVSLQQKNLFPQKIKLHIGSEAIAVTDPTGISQIFLAVKDLKTLPVPSGKATTGCGKIYEISIKAETDFAETVIFWQHAGFSILMGKPEEEKFVTLTHETYTISIYNPKVCPHIFNNPALTYFELDMADLIKKLKDKGVPIKQELPNAAGTVEDAILETPEGQHIFLFKGWE